MVALILVRQVVQLYVLTPHRKLKRRFLGMNFEDFQLLEDRHHEEYSSEMMRIFRLKHIPRLLLFKLQRTVVYPVLTVISMIRKRHT